MDCQASFFGRGTVVKDALVDKIRRRSASICVLGLGYVGLPLAIEIAASGFTVMGIDANSERVEALRQGSSYVHDVKTALLVEALNTGRFKVTDDITRLSKADAVSICVPTPLRKTKDPDLRYVAKAASDVSQYIKPGCLVVLESTTYPGTTEEIIGGAVTDRGFSIGKDVFVAFSPERVDPGNPVFRTKNTPKVIGGITPVCGQIAAALYECFIDEVVVVSSARVAETVKLLENTFRSVNIGLVNEMSMMCDRMGIDIWEVIAAASSKPFGFMPFYPGPGIGGHCIPLDPQYLSWKAKTFDFYNRFIELASDVNGNMPRYAVSRIAEALNTVGKALSASRILVLGAAYKRDINDTRESPSIEIMNLLTRSGAIVDYNDPYVPTIAAINGIKASVSIDPSSIAQYDCVVVGTDHSCYDMNMVCNSAQLVFDTRNSTKGSGGDHVVVLGSGWQPEFTDGCVEVAAMKAED
jgi:UDP-N-acetyl-D-glucosamine dehydrogenase